MTDHKWPFIQGLNKRAFEICKNTLAESESNGIKLSNVALANILDFAVGRHGTIAGGIRLAEICLSGLAKVSVQHSGSSDLALPLVQVRTDNPVEACIGSQYAGWAVSAGEYFAMCSGPARMLRGKEDILTEYALATSSPVAVGVFEANQLPSAEVVEDFAQSCGIVPANAMICVARTASFPGTIQVVSRSVETTMHKLHELGFDISSVKNAIGVAPLPPIAVDDLTALGWTNDSILYGSRVNIWVDTDDALIEKILGDLPSSSSADFGEPFLNIFEQYDRDFYKIDKLLFSPAQVIINNLATGRTFSGGKLRHDILRSSFGM